MTHIFLSNIKNKLHALSLKLINEVQEIQEKADGTPVTKIDKAIETFLREKIMQNFPEDGIIGEEFPAHQPKAPRQWIIDPIDGTRTLIAGFPTFTTLIALMENDRAVISAMLQPITGEFWIGEHTTRTELNGTPVQCRTHITTLEEAHFATTSPFLVETKDKPIIEHFIQHSKLCLLGGDGYAYGKLASGTVDLVIESGMQSYDFMPLIPIVTGAGGIMTDWQGNELTLYSKGQVIAASSEPLHEQAMALLNTA